MLEYYKLGVHSFLIRGFDPFNDTIDFGRELIPRLREGAAELDRAKAACYCLPSPVIRGRWRGIPRRRGKATRPSLPIQIMICDV